jgi:hypothetical protein
MVNNSYSICDESNNNIGCTRGPELNESKILSINLFPSVIQISHSSRTLDLKHKNGEINITFMLSVVHFVHFLPKTPGKHMVLRTGGGGRKNLLAH